MKTDVPKESYFYIYTGEDNADFNIDNISQNCLMIDLNYTPYQLYHTIIPLFEEENNKSEVSKKVLCYPHILIEIEP